MLRCHYQVTGSNERCRCTFCAASNRSVWILVTEIREAKAAQRARPVQKAQETGEINFGWVSHCIAEAASANNDLVILREFDMESDYLETDQPGHYFGISNAGGLGWGLGTALGLRLADPSKIPLVATGDGCCYFGNPNSSSLGGSKPTVPFYHHYLQ